MRVAIITESFPPDVNGVAHCVLRIAELLASGGHHPLVIAPQPPRAFRDEKTSYPFPVVRVPAVPLPGYPGFRLGLPGRRVRAALIRHRPELVHLASPVVLGAHGATVERAQLPAATALRPDVASVVVGINDTLRGDFDPERTGLSVDRTVAALRAAGAEVLTVRLPDPGQMFGLPGALARPLARRMRAVNAAVDEVARRYGTVHLDVACDPATYERRNWSVDRLHPNERGHRLIACRFHALLGASGFPVGPGPDPEPSSPPPTRLAEVHWMATKGTAWLVRRSRDLVPAWWAWRCTSGSAPAAKSRNRKLRNRNIRNRKVLGRKVLGRKIWHWSART